MYDRLVDITKTFAKWWALAMLWLVMIGLPVAGVLLLLGVGS